jgi:hypothetical protein
MGLLVRTPAPASIPARLRKPMARASRVTLFQREIRERLSAPAIELLLDAAEVLSEGQAEPGDARATYYGSTMITIDLAKLADLVREPCDAASARRVSELLAADGRAAARVRKIAEREARRLAGRALGRIAISPSHRYAGSRVFVDVDVEGGVGP